MIKAKFDRYLGLTVLGYVLLLAGCLMPIIVLTGVENLWISLTYNSVSSGVADGFLIIGLLVLSLPLVVLAKYRWLIIPTLLISGIVLIDFLDLSDNFLFGEYMFLPTWIVLFAGCGVLFVISILSFMKTRSQRQATVAA